MFRLKFVTRDRQRQDATIMRFSNEVDSVLREVGWSPGRQRDVTSWRELFEDRDIAMHDAAEGFFPSPVGSP
ncbi:hypothetical protein AOZ06_17070 [Kibdelosporangium phytohabitans]|uniref:Uncharacterized protein n=1 Tax=Kibdelosporangium phytohabitans TaxID=860235 RepID=A0A0N9I1T1_9PSEU|nr:hypothetical protein AOZ06_17070 [Kibdelosporangium phytohabitans]